MSCNPLFAIEYALLFLAAFVAGSAWLGWKSSAKAPRAKRLAMSLCRVLGTLALTGLALNPGRWQAEAEQARGVQALLLDRSGSMAVRDVGGKSRWEAAAALAKATPDAKVRVFADGLERAADYRALVPDGQRSDIVKALKQLLAEPRLQRIVLLSDGRRAPSAPFEDLALQARAADIPIDVLPLGGPALSRNLVLEAPRKNFLAFKGQKLSIPAVAFNHNLGPLALELRLQEPGGKVLAAKKVLLQDNSRAELTLDYTPDTVGFQRLELSLPVQNGEVKATDNVRTLALTVTADKLDALMFEGSPFWDSKFLSQLLLKEACVNFTAVQRISPKRFFMTHGGGKDVETDYQGIFPDSLERLAAYDLIIFGKGAEYFLDAARVALLKRYVSEYGGALLFARSKPYNGSFPELEALEPLQWGEPFHGPFRWEPTAAGGEVGLFGEALPGPGDPFWQKLPPLKNAWRCAGLKSFSEVLAEGVPLDGGRPFPTLISRRFGGGALLTVNSEGLWGWDFFPASQEVGKFYDEFWTQIVQWLPRHSEYLPGQDFSFRLSRDEVWPGEVVSALIGSKDPKLGEPALVTLKDGVRVQEIAPGENGDGWRAALSLSEPGNYMVELSFGTRPELKPAARLPLLVKSPPTEADELSADPDFLRELAAAAGGKVLDGKTPLLAAPAALAADSPKPRSEWVPAWDRGWLLSLALGLFAVECFIRRRNGML